MAQPAEKWCLVTKDHIQQIEISIGREWLDVGRHLELRDEELATWRHTGDRRTAIHQMLSTWKERMGSKATCFALATALARAGRTDLHKRMERMASDKIDYKRKELNAAVVHMAINLSKSDVEMLANLCPNNAKHDRTEIKTGVQLFAYMKKIKFASQNSLGKIIHMLQRKRFHRAAELLNIYQNTWNCGTLKRNFMVRINSWPCILIINFRRNNLRKFALLLIIVCIGVLYCNILEHDITRNSPNILHMVQTLPGQDQQQSPPLAPPLHLKSVPDVLNCSSRECLDMNIRIKPHSTTPLNTSIDFNETTSPTFSTITIFNEQSTYKLLDVLIIKIVSRDWKKEPKTYGGDFFRLKIYSKTPYSAAAEDKLIDFHNGTYLAHFILRWSGEVKVQVKLIHPAELLPRLALTLTGKVGLNMTFVGEFISNDISENVTCRQAPLPPPFCNLSNPRTHGPWYCQKPKDSRLTCSDWKVHKMYKGTFLKLEENLSPLSRKLLKKSHMIEIQNNCTVFVDSVPSKITSFYNHTKSLPYCLINGVPDEIGTRGHFYNNRWYPNDCRVVDYSIDLGMKCLDNKKIIILGDSTSRQVYEYFKDIYKKYFKELPLGKRVLTIYGPKKLVTKSNNASVEFHFHGLPNCGTHLIIPTEFIEYVADRINSGRDGCGAIYILSLWAHFIATGKEFYVQRLLAIKSAIRAFLDRCPESKFIIKGANTRDHPADWIAIVSSEWNIVQHEQALRQIFHDEKRVGFIDALDITKVQPYKDQVHPDKKIVREYVNRILTYLCKSSG